MHNIYHTRKRSTYLHILQCILQSKFFVVPHMAIQVLPSFCVLLIDFFDLHDLILKKLYLCLSSHKLLSGEQNIFNK